MIFTDIEIKDVMYEYLKDSELVSEITGGLYKDARPLNSATEDVVISVLARSGTQFQTLVLNVNVYVKDKKRGQEYIEDTTRLRKLCRLCAELFEEKVFGHFIMEIDSQQVMEIDSIHHHCINNRVQMVAYTDGH